MDHVYMTVLPSQMRRLLELATPETDEDRKLLRALRQEAYRTEEGKGGVVMIQSIDLRDPNSFERLMVP